MFLYFKCAFCSNSTWTHDYWQTIEFQMSRYEICVIMCQKHILQMGMSFGNKLVISFRIEDWVNDDSLFVGLDIVSKYSQLFGFKLGYIKSLSFLLSYNLKIIKFVHLLIFPDIIIY